MLFDLKTKEYKKRNWVYKNYGSYVIQQSGWNHNILYGIMDIFSTKEKYKHNFSQ